VTRALSRKARGMATQALLALRWKSLGLFPFATPTGAGRQGSDIINTPGLAVEVKGREVVSLVAALKQAQSGADLDEVPIVVWRHNGQGEASIADWTVTMRLEDFESLWEKWADRHGQ
jgi:hypothetical protein